MFHLMLVGGGVACATNHGVSSLVPSSSHTDMTDHADMSMDHDPVEHHHAPCETPALADCCQSMTSCAASLAISTVVASSFDVDANGRVVEMLVTAPLSRTVAPEPPPPKA